MIANGAVENVGGAVQVATRKRHVLHAIDDRHDAGHLRDVDVFDLVLFVSILALMGGGGFERGVVKLGHGRPPKSVKRENPVSAVYELIGGGTKNPPVGRYGSGVTFTSSPPLQAWWLLHEILCRFGTGNQEN
jgi:hypothetical protein